MYLLDTCSVSDFVRGEVGVHQRLRETSPQQIAVSSITVMEIEYGLKLNPAKAKKLQPMLEDFLQAVRIVPFANAEAKRAGVLRAALRREGTPVGAYDLLIGATAHLHQFVLVTANAKEFSHIEGLTIENW